MSSEFKFNLQDFLSDMRKEMNDGFEKVDASAAKIREDLVAHELHDTEIAGKTDSRLKSLESAQENIKWAMRALAGAGIVGTVGILFDAFKHWSAR